MSVGKELIVSNDFLCSKILLVTYRDRIVRVTDRYWEPAAFMDPCSYSMRIFIFLKNNFWFKLPSLSENLTQKVKNKRFPNILKPQ